MKRTLAITYLAIGLIFSPIVAHSTDSDKGTNHSGPVTFVKNSVITTKIKTKLAAKTHLGSLKDIKVDTDKNGVVWLSGTAHSQTEVDTAVSIAQNTKGVVEVHNNIKIQQTD